LPNVNFENLNPQFDQVEPQMFVYSTVETAANNLAEVERAESIGLDQVRRFMAEYNLTQAGPLTRVVTAYSADRMSFRVGYPYSGATPLTVVGVQVGETPSGQAMHVLVQGNRANIQAAYAQMNAYMQAHRIPAREGGLPWEVVHEPGSADGAVPTRIEIFLPLQ
jgi:effector-binding domain-containing protein